MKLSHSPSQLESILSDAVTETVRSICFVDMLSDNSGSIRGPSLTGIVGIGGPIAGAVLVTVHETTSRFLFEKMTGDTAFNYGEVSDAVGEITNMVAGLLLTRMGVEGDLALPIVLRGEGQVKPSGAQTQLRLVYAWCSGEEGHSVLAQVTYHDPE